MISHKHARHAPEMKSPPVMIDNARILWWAWAGDEPFGYCSDTPVYGFAVCRNIRGGPFYRFSCDRDWATVNDSDHEDEDAAKNSVPANYFQSSHRVIWHRAGN